MAGSLACGTDSNWSINESAKTSANSAVRLSVDPITVWVNKDTKLYRRPGDRLYGSTKNGQYMTQSEAVKAGYRHAKPNPAKK